MVKYRTIRRSRQRGGLLSGYDAAQSIVEALLKYVRYCFVDPAQLQTIIDGLSQCGDEEIRIVCNILQMLQDDNERANYILSTYGFKGVEKIVVRHLKEAALSGLEMIPVVGPFFTGAKVGASVATAFNNVMMNVDEIQSAGIKTKYMISAAKRYRSIYENAYAAFKADPTNVEKFWNYYDAADAFSQLVGAEYASYAKVPEEVDKAVWSIIESWITRKDNQAQVRSSNNLAAFYKGDLMGTLERLRIFLGLPERADQTVSERTAGEDSIPERLFVINCNEWVSLRTAANSSAERIAQVPLGAEVTDCSWAQNGFVECCFNGQSGYILADYLGETTQAVPVSLTQEMCNERLGYSSMNGKVFLHETIADCTLYAWREWTDFMEHLYVICFNDAGKRLWSWMPAPCMAAELDQLNAFIAGTADAPLAMICDCNEDLHALDFFTGEERWALPVQENKLYVSCYAVDDDGTLYVGGYFGPDPIAISNDGKVLWTSNSPIDAYWLNDIQIMPEGVVASYEMMGENDMPGRICYDIQNGQVMWTEYDTTY